MSATRVRHIESVVPLLALTIGLAQLATATKDTLSPWKGGGFGMFAARDSPGNRFIVVFGAGDDGQWYYVSVPFGQMPERGALTHDIATRLLTFPTIEHLRQVGRSVLRAHVVPADGSRRLPTRLSRSRYRPLLEPLIHDLPTLELSSAGRTASPVLDLAHVYVSVVRLQYNHSHRLVQPRVLLSTVVSRRRHLTPG